MSQNKQSPAEDDKPTKPAETTADLPEREPLTPELVEDEAIRGDFMLRWALVLLTFLLACALIADTRTLVHVKSGQYTLENGMPARTGVFSASAEERPWRNLSWLFDVILAGAYAVGGAIGLSIVTAIIAAVAFGFIAHTNRKDVSSWWGTICAVLALLVCYPQMTAMPEVVTMLGLAVTLYLLNRWREDGERKHLIRLVILFALWSNLDPRMFLGLAVVGLYAIGEWTGNWLGFSSGLENDSRRKTLWITLGLCLVAALLNPYGWHSLLSPSLMYGAEYPAFRELHQSVEKLHVLQYYPMIDAKFWTMLNHNMFSGLVLILAALVTFGLNHRRLDFGHLFIGIGFLSFAVLATHELPAAALVCGVLATLNAQQWYQYTFRQTYSVETSELVFSRGGRVVTVLSLFGLAYLAISGQLYLLDKQGRMTRRAGVGFDFNLQSSIDGLEEDMRESLDDRPFNFSEKQGDLLIWIGQKPFIDSRLDLYAGGDDDLIKRFTQTRNALRMGAKTGDEQGGWKATLDDFKITHVTPRLDTRLASTDPDYITHLGLLNSNDWQLTRFGPTSSVFYRTDIRGGNSELDAYLKDHRAQVTVSAFRVNLDKKVGRTEFARRLTLTEQYLSRPKPKLPNGVLLARHYNWLFETVYTELRISRREGREHRLPRNLFQGAQPDQFLIGTLLLQIRNANEGLLDDPQNAEAYRLLGMAYQRLGEFEKSLIRKQQDPEDLQDNEARMRVTAARKSRANLEMIRFQQAAAAFEQCLVIEPKNIDVTRALAALFEQQRIFDAAIEMLNRSIEIAESTPLPPESDEVARDREERLRKGNTEKLALLSKGIQPSLDRIDAEVSKMGPDAAGRVERVRAIQFAASSGCLKRAVELLEDDLEGMTVDTRVCMFYIGALLQLGRIEDAVSQYTDLSSRNETLIQTQRWRLQRASIAMCTGEYGRAKTTFRLIGRELHESGYDELFNTLPFVAGGVSRLSAVMDKVANRGELEARIEPWAKIHSWIVHQAMHFYPSDAADQLLSAAICDLEQGKTELAAKTLEQALQTAPGSAIRPLVRFYLQLITDKAIPENPPMVGGRAKKKAAKPESKSSGPAPGKKPGKKTATKEAEKPKKKPANNPKTKKIPKP